MGQGNSGIIGAKRAPTNMVATGVWSLSDAQRERGSNNWPGGLPYKTNLVAWFDASLTNTITSSSGAISQWNDLSGNNNHVTAPVGERPTTGAATLNGHNVISFGASQALKRSPVQICSPAFTVICVAKFPDLTSRLQLFGLIDSSSSPGYLFLESNTWQTVGQRFGLYTPDSSWDSNISTSTSWSLFTVSSAAVNGTSIVGTTTYRINQVAGTLTGRSINYSNWVNIANRSGFSIGAASPQVAGGFSGGMIAEIAFYSEALTAGNISLVENHLKNKWGI